MLSRQKIRYKISVLYLSAEFGQGDKLASLENPVGFRKRKTQRTCFHFELVSIHKGRLCLPGGVIGRFKSSKYLKYSSGINLPLALPESQIHHFWTNTSKFLTRQTNPAFGSSAVDDSSARFGCHSFAKSMISGPLNSTGLKCSFHFTIPLFSCT